MRPMPTKYPPWAEGHGDGTRAIHPPYTYAFLSTKPNNPGDAAVYVCPIEAGQLLDTTPLTRTEQATTRNLRVPNTTSC
jgi:hypothetical protein